MGLVFLTMKTYKFIEDPGHGWLEVPRQEIDSLGIAAKITPYSYQKGEMVYLEEDCDMFTFYQAKKDKGEVHRKDWDWERDYQQNTPIRDYHSYQK